MDQAFFPIVLVVLASFFQGTFGLGRKNFKPLTWEAWWLIYAAVAMMAVPWVWALASVPTLWETISGAGCAAVALPALLGFLWGVGGILFGLSISYVGISLTYGIVMGLAGSVGSLARLSYVERLKGV